MCLMLLARVFYIILHVVKQLDVVFKNELRANWGAMSHRILLKITGNEECPELR